MAQIQRSGGQRIYPEDQAAAPVSVDSVLDKGKLQGQLKHAGHSTIDKAN